MRDWPLTRAHGRVVAGSVLAQGSSALGGEGGGGAEAAAALPALPAADGARAPGGPLIHLSIWSGWGRIRKKNMHCEMSRLGLSGPGKDTKHRHKASSLTSLGCNSSLVGCFDVVPPQPHDGPQTLAAVALFTCTNHMSTISIICTEAEPPADWAEKLVDRLAHQCRAEGCRPALPPPFPRTRRPRADSCGSAPAHRRRTPGCTRTSGPT